MTAATRFVLPQALVADTPPERRGTPRDEVRMLVVDTGLSHRRACDLARVLEPGDLLLVNTSATLPSALDGTRRDGRPALIHVATELDSGDWVIEVRRGRAASGHVCDVEVGEWLGLPTGDLVVLASYPIEGDPGSRLWRCRSSASRAEALAAHGRPVSYGARRWPPRDYQTVFAQEPGSAEMPSAGRAFTASLLVELVARGVVLAPVTLHCGLSSPDAHEPPTAERFVVPASTAALVNEARASSRRVIAVGTTAVRAIETCVDPTGLVRPGSGWTTHVVGPDAPVRAVDGLLTGLHEPEASHLLLLEALAGPERVAAAYGESLREGYLWHEFGDLTLFL